MSVSDDLRDYLVAGGLASLANFTVSRVSTVNLAENDQWVVFAQGGGKEGGNILQWKRKHNVVIAYRNSSAQALYNKDDVLQTLLEACVTLTNYKVLRITCSPMNELDISNSEIHVAQWQITLELVKK
jgi:hypothetical protein